MVCVYCSSPTAVKNSRLQRQNNHIWRRRSCQSCGSVFTTIEQPELSGIFVVDSEDGGNHKLEPLSRDSLFLTVYESCKHRPNAINEAASLTQTIVNNLVLQNRKGTIQRDMIVSQTHAVLKRFDAVAATFFAAYHKINDATTS